MKALEFIIVLIMLLSLMAIGYVGYDIHYKDGLLIIGKHSQKYSYGSKEIKEEE
jgi:hypothetical protein